MPTPRTASTNLPEKPFRILSDNGKIITAEMTVQDWCELPDHPRQRNTARHAHAGHWMLAKQAKGAVLDHLAHVTAAVLEGNYYKVDGHTRAYLWETGQLKAPDTLHVTMYRVASKAELNELYTVFDTQSAAETSFDKVFGAYREHGLTLTSKRLKNGFIVDALNIALRGVTRANQDKRKFPEIDIYKAVGAFKDELMLLDGVNPQPEVYYSGVIAAALIALSLYPHGIDFFQKLAGREGNKRNGRMDPVEAVLVFVDRLKQERSSWVNAQQEELCARTFRAFLAWEQGRQDKGQFWFKSKLRAIDVRPFIQEMKVKKAITDELQL
ncbi:MAG: hypothetical protein U1F68_13120 [Gammaproteobacteria bacterium]